MAGFLALPVLALSVGVPWAQDGSQNGGGGFIGQLTIGQRLSYENETGTTSGTNEGTRTETTVDVQLSSDTRNQSFDLGLSGNLRYILSDPGPRDRFNVQDPSARLSYAIESRSTRLSLAGTYRRSDIDETAFLINDDDPDSEIITGGGTRSRLGIDTTLELGRDAPLSAQLTHSYGETRYSDTTDASLVDTETEQFGVRLSYRLNPTTQLAAFAQYREREADGPGSTDRTSLRYGIEADYTISPTLTATAALSYSDIETDDNAGTVTNTDGINLRFGLTRDMLNGTMGLSFREEETVNGKRRQIRLTRGLDYARGSLDLTLGATKTDGLDLEPLVSASASYIIDPVSQLTLSLSQSSVVNDDNEESINSRLSLGYRRDLSEISSLSANFSLVDRNALTVAGEDQTSTRIDLTHRYALARDFNLVSSYRRSWTERDGQPDETDTVISLGLEKTFNFRP